MTGLILVACGSAKASSPQPPRRLYTGSLFLAASRYAASTGQPWRIVSALHGALEPDGAPIAPYDVTLRNMTPPARKAWAAKVLEQLGPGPHVSLMGLAYDHPLMAVGMQLERPLDGMRLGYRMQWLARHTHEQTKMEVG